MAAASLLPTVGKYGLKIADEAADWLKNIKFSRNADLAVDGDQVMVVNVDDIERQLSYGRGGRDQLIEPGGINPSSLYPDTSVKYANFVEFAENTDQPIHMPTLKVDSDGMIEIADGRVTLAAMRDAGLKEIPVVINSADADAIPGHMLSTKGMVAAKEIDIPTTKPVDYTPKQLTTSQQKQFNAQVEAGRPAHTAKSIVLGEMPMDQASREARRIQQNLTETGYHGSKESGIASLDAFTDFWMSQNPAVANTYVPKPYSGSAVYQIAYDPSKYAKTDAKGEFWSSLDQIPMNIRLPGESIPITSKALKNQYMWERSLTDTDDMAELMNRAGVPGIEINNVRDAGHNFMQARNLYTDAEGNLNNKAWNAFLSEYETFGGKNIVAVGDKTGLRSVTGAAFDPRNKALPNIMGGSAALAVGLGSNDSEAAVKRLDAIMAGGMKTPAQQAQAVISGKPSRQGPTYEAVTNKTISDNLQANPDVGSITGIQPGVGNQLRGQAAFALQDFGKSAQDAGPAGFIAGSTIEHIGDALQKGAYGESDWYDVPLVALDLMALNPMSYLSSGMRSAMNNPDAKASIFKELFGN